MILTLFSRPGCHLCDQMKEVVRGTLRETGIPAQLEEVNIGGDGALEARYGAEIPVLLVNGRKAAKYRVTKETLTRILRAGETEGAGRAGEAG